MTTPSITTPYDIAPTPSFHIDPALYTGGPQNPMGRPEKELRAYDLLDSLKISYTRIDHEAMPTIEACHDVDKLLGIEICKNLFLRNAQKTDFYLLLMPGMKRFKTSILSKQIGSARLSFAEPEYMREFLDITPGSVSVLGLMNDKDNRVRLLIDADVINGQEYFGCHPCINTSSLRLQTRDLLDKILPAIKHPYTLVDLPRTE